ncbi:hypothetical protein Taro_021726 [Colocasia esculenta]|uniref:HVA22-like protein n=1 Tax=Colocasia esculenta TaxID=4460 RepID=A0A843V5T8_COLES|nr:hypothetical protein [Colocasia esculenta]
MLVYPLYASVQAIESPGKEDDEQWLAYWILYSFLTLMEMVAEPILYWLPIWYPVKLVFVAWLVLPQFRGAAFIYERFVREQLQKYGVSGGRRPAKVIIDVTTFLYPLPYPKAAPVCVTRGTRVIMCCRRRKPTERNRKEMETH